MAVRMRKAAIFIVDTKFNSALCTLTCIADN